MLIAGILLLPLYFPDDFHLPAYGWAIVSIFILSLCLINLSYIRHQEFEADDIATHYLGVPVIVDTFEILSKILDSIGHAIDHPSWRARIERQHASTKAR